MSNEVGAQLDDSATVNSEGIIEFQRQVCDFDREVDKRIKAIILGRDIKIEMGSGDINVRDD